jgi:dihydrofolate synthase/folylpolyglutamate synthase
VSKPNTLPEWLQYIETSHTQEIDMGLDRVVKVFDRLGLDFSEICVVSVAGTNGKGTTCRFIEQACLHVPFRVGVYASPHLLQFNERIRMCGVDVDDDTLCAAFAQVYEAAQGNASNNGAELEYKCRANESAAAESISLSYFEYATLCSLVIFVQSDIDICILEVGLGGRLDATNIIDAHIGVITSIGLDHQAYLGNTTEAISAEKAGIIKPAQQVVIGYSNMDESVNEVLKRFSNEALLRDRDFGVLQDKKNSLLAGHGTGWINVNGISFTYALQDAKIPPQNIMTALASMHLIARFFNSPNSLLLEHKAIENLIDTVCVPGRFETLNASPHIILDVAHNEDSAKYLLTRMQQKRFAKCHIVIGMLKDKNIEATIDQLSALNAKWYCVDLPSQRGEKADRLQKAVNKHGQEAQQFENVALGLQQAIVHCRTNDIILGVGSFVLAASFVHALSDYQRCN